MRLSLAILRASSLSRERRLIVRLPWMVSTLATYTPELFLVISILILFGDQNCQRCLTQKGNSSEGERSWMG